MSIFNISKLSDGNEIPISINFSFNLPKDMQINENSPVECTFSGSLRADKEFFLLQGKGECEVRLACSNCLEEVFENISLDISEKFSNKMDYLEAESLDVNAFKGFDLDIEEVVYQNFIMALPNKIVCSEECKGLCSICGTNLNINDCDCVVVHNPQFAEILDMFKD